MGFVEVQIKDDTFTPFMKQLKSRLSGGQLSGHLKDQEQVFYTNLHRSFREQIYGTDQTEQKWQDLKDVTVKKRIKRGNWKGMANSILKETLNLYWELARHFKVGKEVGGYYAKLFAPSTSHTGYKGKSGLSFNDLARTHQYGTNKIPARPPFSFLLETREKLINNFLSYFWK